MKNNIQNPTPIDSRITDVTVYLSGAQVTRTGSVVLTEESQSFIFEKLPHGLQPESIRVSAEDGIVVRSVEHTVNHLKSMDHTKEITILQQKLNDLAHQIQQEENKIELGELEENLFSENIHLAGSDSGLTAENLKSAVLFYNERMAAIREIRMVCNKQIEELNREMSAVQHQLGNFDYSCPEPVSEITVTIFTNLTHLKNQPKSLTISYFVYNASWRPSYDIRVKDTSDNVGLHYKANISQTSGENWEDVKLILSTGNPSINGACPDLKPWYIDFYKQPNLGHFQQFNASPAFASAKMMSRQVEMDNCEIQESCCDIRQDELPLAPPQPQAVITESVTSVEYNITAPYTIDSGDGGQDVDITVHSLPATYRYYSVRKLEREVFLLAAISDWEHLNLIAGDASIFFENRYVGKTTIDPRRAGEKIDLSLGVDKSVIVTRVRGKDFTAKTLTGTNTKQSRQWEITARNLKPTAIDIELIDQIPVSVDKQITVDATELSGAELDKDTGILTWKFTLKPTESKSMTVKYTVTNPKNTTVYLD